MNIIYLDQLLREVKRDKVSSCIVYKDDAIIFEYYKSQKLINKKHKVYSLTKSIVSALFGIAVHHGYIENENISILKYFPDLEEHKKEIEIRHLLMMASGLSWPGNEAMIPSKNWINFILDQSLEILPGEKMTYSCGNSHLISSIIQKATLLDTISFAKKYLFSPLGINDFEWHQDSRGIPIGGFGMSMKTEDMLKFGVLFLNEGLWEGKTIIPAKWIEESTSGKLILSDLLSYGYHWWVLNNDEHQNKTYYAMGMRGQYIFINKTKRIVAVMTSNFEDNDAGKPVEFFKNYILRE